MRLRRGRALVLFVHGTRPLELGDAPGPPGAVHDDPVAPGGVRRPAGDPDDGRREVSVEGRLRRVEPVVQPRPLPPPHARERQGHHRLRLRQGPDLHLLRLRVRRRDVPEHRQDMEVDHLLASARGVRLRRTVKHRPVRLPRDPGRALLRDLLPHPALAPPGRPRPRGLPHPLRDRPGSLLPPHARRRPQARPAHPHTPRETRPHPLKILPPAPGLQGQDELLRPQLGHLPHRLARRHRAKNQDARLLRRQRDRQAAARTRRRPRRRRLLPVAQVLPRRRRRARRHRPRLRLGKRPLLEHLRRQGQAHRPPPGPRRPPPSPTRPNHRAGGRRLDGRSPPRPAPAPTRRPSVASRAARLDLTARPRSSVACATAASSAHPPWACGPVAPHSAARRRVSSSPTGRRHAAAH
mmetsp:Transcript_9367/g.29878  ORF Transcript_9367/g.29878 Transcript_9367/m.29878 type:complete len:409 (-) Transcript_9367:79-1305(-)